MTVKLSRMSRLRFARLIRVGGVESWEQPTYPEIDTADDDIIYTVEDGDRIDRLADRFYGATELWWVIAIANSLKLLPNDVYAGQTIRIPSRRRTFDEIVKFPSRGREGQR